MNKTVFIAGFYGFNIVGDECILASMIDDLRKLCNSQDINSLSFIVSSQCPAKTSEDYHVEAVHWQDLGKVVESIRKSDIVLVGGGGIFNEYTEWKHEDILTAKQEFNVFCVSVAVIAKALQKPCMLYAVGVEPLYSEVAKKDVSLAFRLVDTATVRDYGSFDILKNILEKDVLQKVKVTADPAFKTPLGDDVPLEIGKKPVVGLCLRNWDIQTDQESWLPTLVSALDSFGRSTDCSYLCIPFHNSPEYGPLADDMTLFERMKQLSQEGERYRIVSFGPRPLDVPRIMNECDLVLAMRFHSIILATRNQTPFVAIEYSLKVKSAVKNANMEEYSIDINELTADKIRKLLHACLLNSYEIKKRLVKSFEKLENMAAENSAIALNLLNGKSRKGRQSHIKSTGSDDGYAYLLGLLLQQTDRVVSQSQMLQIAEKQENLLENHIRKLVDRDHDYAQAEELLHELVDIHPLSGKYHYLLALCLQAQNRDSDIVLQHYRKAEELGFFEFWIRYNRGLLYAKLGKKEDAMNELKKAAILNSSHEGLMKAIQDLADSYSS